MSIHQFASGLCTDPQVNISFSYPLLNIKRPKCWICLISDGKLHNYLECIIELMYCIKLNVLLSYIGCKLYDPLLQNRVIQ